MGKMDLTLVIVVFSISIVSSSDIYSSTTHIRHMALSQGLLASVMQKYLEKEQEKLNHIKR